MPNNRILLVLLKPIKYIRRKLIESVKKMCNLEIGGYRFYDGSGNNICKT